MSQVKIYGHAAVLAARRRQISDAIHRATVQELGLPEEERYHRFFGLADEDFVHPRSRSAAYLILEIHLFRGRTARTLRGYILALQASLEDYAGVAPNDVEILLIETPRSHWAVRGQPADDLTLPYEVNR